MKKKLFALAIIILGVILCLIPNKVQGAEITSVFTGEKLNRKSIQTIEAFNSLEKVPITIERKASNYKYNGNKDIWKFSDQDNPDEIYYCLNYEQGFAETTAEYNSEVLLTLDNLKKYTKSSKVIEWTEDKFNKLLWILDHIYVPDSSFENINEDPDFIELLKDASINIETSDNNEYNLIKDDVIATQQLAIWYFTNDMNVISSISGAPDEDHRDMLTGDTIYSRLSKMKTLCEYFANTASETYKREEPELEVVQTDATIQESENSYILGPYTLKLTKGDKASIKSIKVDSETNYTLLDKSQEEVNDNNFKNVIGENFYIKISKNHITQSSEIQLNIQYTYNERTCKLMTNEQKIEQTQPIVNVKETENEVTFTATIELQNIQVEKQWEDAENQDGVRPTSIEVQLYLDEQPLGNSETLNAENEWTFIWYGLLSGKNYSVKELNSNKVAVENNGRYDNNYTASYVIADNKTTITNQHTPEVVEKTVRKVWVDSDNQDGIRPDSIEVQLYKNLGIEKVSMGDDYKAQLNEENGWTKTWGNLPAKNDGQDIIYSVEEINVPDGYTVQYSAETYEEIDIITITNIHQLEFVRKTVKKAWVDSDNQNGIRPNNIKVQLYKTVGDRTQEVGDEITLQESNSWSYTWSDLPSKENEQEITYTVKELNVPNKYVESYSNENYNDTDIITITNTYIYNPFDLALRKFITKVNDTDYNNRYPEVEFTEGGEVKYNHTKDPVTVKAEDIIIYTIRVYNEGEKAGYAEEITDNLPEGLEYLPDNEINKQYGWKLIDAEGNETEDITKAVKVTTDYLKDKLLNGITTDENGEKILSYEDVQIAFKVEKTEEKGRIIENIAQISKDSDDDIDSTPDNNDPTEDDEDKEYVKEQYFDLSLKKWVTETRATYKGKTTVTKTGFTEDSEEMAKVDLVASQMSKTTVKFAYTIKVTNEGEIAGYAEEVKDYIPEGLEFKAEDNPDWKEVKKGEVVTEKLKDTLLNPGESATVEIILTWKNGTNNTGVKTNYAEISKDSDDDIDSTPDNYNKQEDDIDDAQVILSIKTSEAPIYIGLIFTSTIILAGGIYLIKRYVIN